MLDSNTEAKLIFNALHRLPMFQNNDEVIRLKIKNLRSLHNFRDFILHITGVDLKKSFLTNYFKSRPGREPQYRCPFYVELTGPSTSYYQLNHLGWEKENAETRKRLEKDYGYMAEGAVDVSIILDPDKYPEYYL
jgi:hypothetical protein